MGKKEAMEDLLVALERDPLAPLDDVAVDREPAAKRIALPTDRLCELYEAGMGYAAIAGIYGVSEDTVRRRLLEAGVRLRHATEVYPQDRPSPSRAAEEYAEGKSQEEIGAHHGVSRSPARDALLRANIQPRGPSYDIPVDLLAECWRDGASTQQLADALGVSQATVQRRLGEVVDLHRRRRGLPGAEIAAAYEAGWTIEELARVCEVSIRPISAAVKAAGIKAKGGNRARPLPVDEMVAMYKAGASLKEVGAAYGVSSDTAKARLVVAGATIRKRGGRKNKQQ